MKITASKVLNIKPLDTYLCINLSVIIIFLLINPLYALFITVLISLFFGRINEWLIGFLFVISFTLMFANQVFIVGVSDIGSYVHMYHGTENPTTYLDLFYTYLANINGHEFLWFYFSKILGSLVGYSDEIYIFTVYLLIFSLIAYVAYLSSENGRYNFVLILFGLVFLEVTLFSNAYDLWRTEIASLMFILSLLIGDSKKSKYLYRVIMYSSIFVHTTMILLVGFYEIYSLFMTKKVFKFHGILFYVKLVILTLSVIILLSFVDRLVPYLAYFNNFFLGGYERYAHLNIEYNFNVNFFLQPVYILILGYIIFNYRHIKHYEVFAIFAYIVVVTMPYIANSISMLYARSSIVPLAIMTIMAVKFLKNLPINYTMLFVFIIFFYRMYVNYHSSLSYLEFAAKGEMLSLNYGLLASIVYFYDPFIFST
jgi:hypothetical protein